ncbi:MAG: sarcosine oxidase subunit gamma, partial [Burkholderiales bacterium]|nr:sarcosine oxidase subunit gamma [Burkholderiales bacterium]
TSGVKQVLGVNVPEKASTVTSQGDTSILWLGPDEWLIVMPDGREDETAQSLDEALSGCRFALTNV